jgi:hypothetical protein
MVEVWNGWIISKGWVDSGWWRFMGWEAVNGCKEKSLGQEG